MFREGFLEEKALSGILGGRQEGVRVLLAERSGPDKDGGVVAGDLLGEAGSLRALLPWRSAEGRPNWGWPGGRLGTPGCRWGAKGERRCAVVSVILHGWDRERCPYQAPLPSSGRAWPVAPAVSVHGGRGPSQEHGPGTELVFSVGHLCARPHPQPLGV